MINRIRKLVRATLPPDATVLVASRGDNELLGLNGLRTWHFPRTDDGSYAGHNPADSAEAIAHLETLRAKGGEFLLFPSTALWWLEHYGALREYLETRCQLAASQADTCLIFALGKQPARTITR